MGNTNVIAAINAMSTEEVLLVTSFMLCFLGFNQGYIGEYLKAHEDFGSKEDFESFLYCREFARNLTCGVHMDVIAEVCIMTQQSDAERARVLNQLFACLMAIYQAKHEN